MASSDAEEDCTLYDDSDYPREADTDCDSENDLIYVKTTSRLRAASPSPQSLIVSLPRRYAHSHEQMLQRSVSEESDGVPDPMKCVLCYQVLLDPVSLLCGHTFCQVCLVRMKMTRPFPFNNNDCPMCRKPWADIPAVNIILRETIEKNYPRKLAQRTEQLSPEEKRAITDQQHSSSTTHQQIDDPENAMIIVGCVCIFGLIAIAISLSVLFLALRSIGGGFVTKPVSQWSTDDVMKWMSIQGETVQQDCKEVFERERIDGPHLFLLTNETLVGLNITRQFTIESLLVSINRLKKDEYVHPTSFSEFYTAYPVQTVWLALSFRNAPRCTFIYLYLFHYNEIFLPFINVHPFQSTEPNDGEVMVVQQDTSWLKMLTVLFEVLVVPQVPIGIFALGWVWDHPVLCSLVWLHCLVLFIREVKLLHWYYGVRRNIPMVQVLSFPFSFLMMHFLITAVSSLVLSVFPMFLLNILYYWAVALVLFDSLIQPIVIPAFHFIMNTIRGAH